MSNLKSKYYTPEQRLEMIEDIRRDNPIKLVASKLSITPQTVCRFAARVGFRRMYVTDQERRELLKRRNVHN